MDAMSVDTKPLYSFPGGDLLVFNYKNIPGYIILTKEDIELDTNLVIVWNNKDYGATDFFHIPLWAAINDENKRKRLDSVLNEDSTF